MKKMIMLMMAFLGVLELTYCVVNYERMIRMVGTSVFMIMIIVLPILIIASFSIATEDLY